MAKFCPLFSSSSGNCIYIGTSDGGILIDAGVSAKRITGALENIGVSPDSISAIFITHEHSDHINGLRVFAGSRNIDVYASAGTLRALDSIGILNGKFTAREISENGAEAAGIYVKPFATPHDAAQSCGYTAVTPDGRRISIATDLGHVTDTVMNAIYGSDLVMLESNHEIDLLRRGPYPYPLKQRILSDIGHLSNTACSDAAVKLRGACAEYSKRLSAFCKLKITELTPARIPDDPSRAQIDSALADEGKRILQLIHQSARVYAMCIEGKQLSSEELSRDIEQAAVGGSGNFVFIIGGSHGLTDEVKRRANFKLSMSKMTFPHQLARVMLLEQIYRAFMISSGGKYHK